jgi:hypothetical protein
MNAVQYAMIVEILPRLSDDDLETLRKVIEQMQDARRTDKLLPPPKEDNPYVW